MAVIATYYPISSTTLGSNSAGVTFSSLPSTYTDLAIVIQEPDTATGSNEHGLQFNGDIGNNTNTNYSFNGWASNGSSTAVRSSTGTYKYSLGGSVASETTHIYIYDYSNSSYYKGIQAEYQQSASGSSWMSFTTGSWLSTAAITSIRIDTWGSAYNYLFQTGTIFTLYGIKAG